MFDGRLITNLHWYWVAWFALGHQLLVFIVRRVIVYLFRIIAHFFFSGNAYDAQRPFQKTPNILYGGRLLNISMLIVYFFEFLYGVRSVWIWKGRKPFSIRYKYFITDH